MKRRRNHRKNLKRKKKRKESKKICAVAAYVNAKMRNLNHIPAAVASQ
jgi:hypothetical protein